ncbi:epiphycan isoform 1-T2 [Lycodopsis pacificus]
MRMLVRLALGLFVLKAVVAGPRFSRQVDLDSYDNANYDVDLDNSNLENQDIYDYEDGLTIDDPQIEIGTLAPPDYNYPVPEASLEEEVEEEEEEELPLTPQLIPQGSGGSGVLMGPDTQKGMPTCLLCTCLGGSVYCDDLKLDSVPPLPKDTTHFYARYNRITKINKSDFAFMNKLKRIDLTANEIMSIDERAFLGLPELEELVIRENHISQLPALPETMSLIDGSHNNIGSKGIHREAFKDMTSLLYLYLTDNHIDYIPVPLPDSLRSLHLQRNNIQMMHGDTFCNLKDFNYIRNALEDIRLDGNPINLSRTPQAYVCLPRIPIGDLI